jgi:hypothetical protein
MSVETINMRTDAERKCRLQLADGLSHESHTAFYTGNVSVTSQWLTRSPGHRRQRVGSGRPSDRRRRRH